MPYIVHKFTTYISCQQVTYNTAVLICGLSRTKCHNIFFHFIFSYFEFTFIFLFQNFSFFKQPMVAVFRANFGNILQHNDTFCHSGHKRNIQVHIGTLARASIAPFSTYTINALCLLYCGSLQICWLYFHPSVSPSICHLRSAQ